MARERTRARSPHASSELHKLTPRRVSERLQQRVPARAQDWGGRCAKCGLSYRAVHLVPTPATCLLDAHPKGMRPVFTQNPACEHHSHFSPTRPELETTQVSFEGGSGQTRPIHTTEQHSAEHCRPCASHHDPVPTAGSQGDRPHTA